MKASRMLAFAGSVAIALGLVCSFAACALLTSSQYEPVSYGNASGSQCYYVMNPGEVLLLKKHHKCKPNAQPVVAPVPYVSGYYPYLTSKYYIGTFVPSAQRASYETFMADFEQVHAAEIKTDAPQARYVGDNGDTVSGSDIGLTSDGTHIATSDSSTSFGDTGGSASSDAHGGTLGGEHGSSDSGGDHPIVVDPGK